MKSAVSAFEYTTLAFVPTQFTGYRWWWSGTALTLLRNIGV
ncbi:MAG: hypothetical protein ACJATT_002988 [Myxococcota bacterium]|jgi:hypothetical protein